MALYIPTIYSAVAVFELGFVVSSAFVKSLIEYFYVFGMPKCDVSTGPFALLNPELLMFIDQESDQNNDTRCVF